MQSMRSSLVDDGHIQVVCRVRPPNKREMRGISMQKCVSVDGNEATIILETKGDSKAFHYDYSAGETVSQESIFERVGLPVTKRCLEGYNGTILCYGQTGSGKTYTIFGPQLGSSLSGSEQLSHRGIVPRVLEYLWATIGSKENHSFRCSFYEIYQEKIFDLLDSSSHNIGGLAVREDANLGVYVEGCKEQRVESLSDATAVLAEGYKNRHVSETAMNRLSSRSHAVFQLTIESRYTDKRTGASRVVTARFSMVDLAGSERQKDTQATGSRLKEASVINKSLTCLGRVINELISTSPTTRAKRKRHINYRDSKLTFLLRDSLGGNSKTTLIATVSPAESCYNETLSTLYFAQRSRGVCNIATVNSSTVGSLESLQAEITSLRAQVEVLSRARSPTRLSASGRRRLSANRALIKGDPANTGDVLRPISDKFNSPKSRKSRMSRTPPRRSSICDKENSPGNTPEPPMTPCTKGQFEKLIEDNTLLMQINRELEDALAAKEAELEEQSKNLQITQDTLEKCEYELEVSREAAEGRFSHTKVLLATLEQTKQENNAMAVEIQALQFARDALTDNLEDETQLRSRLQIELEEAQLQRSIDSRRITDLEAELAAATQRISELEFELSFIKGTVTQPSGDSEEGVRFSVSSSLSSRLRESSTSSAAITSVKSSVSGDINERSSVGSSACTEVKHFNSELRRLSTYASIVYSDDSYLYSEDESTVVKEDDDGDCGSTIVQELDFADEGDTVVRDSLSDRSCSPYDDRSQAVSLGLSLISCPSVRSDYSLSSSGSRTEIMSIKTSDTLVRCTSKTSVAQTPEVKSKPKFMKQSTISSEATGLSISPLVALSGPSQQNKEVPELKLKKKKSFVKKVFSYFGGRKSKTAQTNYVPCAPVDLTCKEVYSENNTGKAWSSLIVSWTMSPTDKQNKHPNNMSDMTYFEVQRYVSHDQEKELCELTDEDFIDIGTSRSLCFLISVKDLPSCMIYFRVRAVINGARSAWSSVTSICTPSIFVPTLQRDFQCIEPFDENGVLYWIGTEGGEREYSNPHTNGNVGVKMSCKWYCADAAVYVEHRPPQNIELDTNYPCSWISLDLGAERLLVPNFYCLRGYDKMKNILVSWELQGRRSSSENWVTIKRHMNDTEVSKSDGSLAVASWHLKDICEPFRYFRLLQLDCCGPLSKTIPCSGIELYGTLLQTEMGKRASTERKKGSLVCTK